MDLGIHKNVLIINEETKSILDSLLFTKWLSSLSTDLTLHSVELLSSKTNTAGELTYLKLSVTLFMNGHRIPRYIYLEGPSIAVLLYSKSNEQIQLFVEEKAFIANGKIMFSLPYAKFPHFIINHNEAKNLIESYFDCYEFIERNFKILNESKEFVESSTTNRSFLLPLPGNSDERIHFYLYDATDEFDLIKSKIKNKSCKFENIETLLRTTDNFVTKAGILLLKKYLSQNT